jgi:formylglycine-generating enzyme required for sulfatase activity
MIDLFLAFRPGAEDLADQVGRAIEALKEINRGETYPIAVVRDDPALPDETWTGTVGPRIDEAEIVLLLVTTGPDGAFDPDSALRRAVDRAVAAGRRIVPLAAEDLPGFLDTLGIATARYRAAPEGGAGVAQLPFDGDEGAWLAALVREIRGRLDRLLDNSGRPPLDAADAALACLDAARRVRDAALAEREILEGGYIEVVGAADSLDDALATDGAHVIRIPRGRLADARRLIRAAYPAAGQTAAAISHAAECWQDFADANVDAGRPPPADADAAPIWIEAVAPAAVLDPVQGESAIARLNLEGTADDAQRPADNLARGSPRDEPAASALVQIRAETLGRAVRQAVGGERAQSRRSRMRSLDPFVPGEAKPNVPPSVAYPRLDARDLAAAWRPLANAIRALLALLAVPLKGLSRATRDLIGAAGDAARRVENSVRVLVDQALGRRPRPPARETPGTVWRDEIPGVGPAGWPVMVTLPRGRFQMGSPPDEAGRSDDEGPVHAVTIRSIVAFGIAPVTFAQWDAARDAAREAGARLPAAEDQGWGRETRPVINVSWEDARDYIRWLNGRLNLTDPLTAYRLPTEAEWEYACRAGTTTPFSFGETITTEQANFDGNYAYGGAARSKVYLKRTTPVASFPPNAFRLHDMHGNVYEWCADAWNKTYDGAPTDGPAWLTGDTSLRVVRGGSWSNLPQGLRSADRGRYGRTLRYYDIGFRLARTLSPPTP